MTDSSSKAVTVPTFSGKSEDFELYWPRIEAYASMKGFAESIDAKKTDPDLPVRHDAFDADPTVAKKQKEAVERNKIAVAAFTLSFKTAALMNIVNDSKTAEYPKGLAHLIAKELCSQYSPKDRVSKVEATNALRQVKMGNNAPPDKFINKLKAIKVQYTGDITDEMIINEIMVKAPGKYQSIIATECLKQGSNLEVRHLKEAMNTIYRMNTNTSGRKGSGEDSDDDGEVVGAAINGECFSCGKRGHRFVDCPLKNKGKTGAGRGMHRFNAGRGRGRGRGGRDKPRFKGTCNNCGKIGHMKRDCWSLDDNKHKKYASQKTGETGNTAIAGDEISVLAAEAEELCDNCHEDGKELSLFCVKCNDEDDEEKEKNAFEMKKMMEICRKIADKVEYDYIDVSQAFRSVPMPRESKWYIDTDDEDSDWDEPPKLTKRKRDENETESVIEDEKRQKLENNILARIIKFESDSDSNMNSNQSSTGNGQGEEAEAGTNSEPSGSDSDYEYDSDDEEETDEDEVEELLVEEIDEAIEAGEANEEEELDIEGHEDEIRALFGDDSDD